MTKESTDEVKRVALQLRVRPETRVLLEQLADEKGMANTEFANRLLDWFAQQPEVVRDAIMYRRDAAAELVKLKMAEAAAGGELPATLDEALAVAKASLARVEYIAGIYKRELAERLDIGGQAPVVEPIPGTDQEILHHGQAPTIAVVKAPKTRRPSRS